MVLNSLYGYFYDPYTINGSNWSDTLYINNPFTHTVNGHGGSDRIHLNTFRDVTVDGGSGSDYIYFNGLGDITAFGGSGSDRFYVNHMGDHSIDGGTGYDRVDFSDISHALRIDLSSPTSGTAVEFNGHGTPVGDDMVSFQNVEYIYGSSAGDWFYGSSQDDWFYGGDGDDAIFGFDGDDFLNGQDGADNIYLGNGNDIAFGGDGQDYIRGDDGDDRIYGQNDNDILLGSDGDDYMLGGGGNDKMYGGDGEDSLYGGSGDDFIEVATMFEEDAANDFYSGGSGTDVLSYANAKGSVYINADYGQVSGAGAGTPVVSTSGPFTITMNFLDTISGFETYIGTDFDDTFRGSNSSVQENFFGGLGDDRFIASDGDDRLYGNAGSDTADYSQVTGWVDADLSEGTIAVMDFEPGETKWEDEVNLLENVIGGNYNDQLRGHNGANVLEGRAGNDVATGRNGEDTFVFRGDADFGDDRVTDFQSGEDVLLLEELHNAANGQAIFGFDDLDSNGDDRLTAADNNVSASNGDMTIEFDEGSIALDNVSQLFEADFLFA